MKKAIDDYFNKNNNKKPVKQELVPVNSTVVPAPNTVAPIKENNNLL